MSTTTPFSQTPAASDTGATPDEAQTAVQRLREQADAVVQRIQPRIAAVSTYVREEPTKALLISAATGAALMGLVALLVRSSSRQAAPGQARAASLASTTMAAIRDAALDLADRAQAMASDALDAAQQRAANALDSVQQRAAGAIDAAKVRANEAFDATKQRASDTLDAQHKRAADALDEAKQRTASAAERVSASAAEAWKSVRDQAQPVVDKVRPQLDAVANYAKEDPARAALGAAAAAALVIGLVALVRRSQDD